MCVSSLFAKSSESIHKASSDTMGDICRSHFLIFVPILAVLIQIPSKYLLNALNYALDPAFFPDTSSIHDAMLVPIWDSLLSASDKTSTQDYQYLSECFNSLLQIKGSIFNESLCKMIHNKDSKLRLIATIIVSTMIFKAHCKESISQPLLLSTLTLVGDVKRDVAKSAFRVLGGAIAQGYLCQSEFTEFLPFLILQLKVNVHFI